MENLIELLKEVNISQVIIIIASMWVFYNRLDTKIEKLDKKIEKLEDRIQRIENDMIEIKTVLRMKECCMIKDEKQIKKVES